MSQRKIKAKMKEFLKTLNSGSQKERLTALMLYSYQVRENTFNEAMELIENGKTKEEIESRFKSPL